MVGARRGLERRRAARGSQLCELRGVRRCDPDALRWKASVRRRLERDERFTLFDRERAIATERHPGRELASIRRTSHYEGVLKVGGGRHRDRRRAHRRHTNSEADEHRELNARSHSNLR